LLVLALVVPGLARAGETARQILDRRKALEDGVQHWNDRHQRMKLTIIDKRGGERVRELETYERRFPDDESKSIVFFLAPAEVKGTGFLAFNHKGRPADQWLYLPELQRVRQITARARNESFMGTDFSYHDLDLMQEMPKWTEADATSSLRGDEPVDGMPTHAIELKPQREDIGYQKIVLWLGTEDLVPRRIELYDADKDPKKRIAQSNVKMIGSIPTPETVKVETPSTGSHTTIDVSDVQFNQNLEDELFSERFLERGQR
jgi:outer membrane lipoprotein-sorting protein